MRRPTVISGKKRKVLSKGTTLEESYGWIQLQKEMMRTLLI